MIPGGDEGDTDCFDVQPDEESPMVFKFTSMENKEVQGFGFGI